MCYLHGQHTLNSVLSTVDSTIQYNKVLSTEYSTPLIYAQCATVDSTLVRGQHTLNSVLSTVDSTIQ